jgi:hypothetical protein
MFNIKNIYVLPTQSICVLYGFRKKQLLIPYTALTVFFYNQEEVCLLSGASWIFRRIQFNLSLSRVKTDLRSDKIIFSAVLLILQLTNIKVTGYPKFSLFPQIYLNRDLK